HPAAPGHPIVAEFMNENRRPEEQNNGSGHIKHVENGHHRKLNPAYQRKLPANVDLQPQIVEKSILRLLGLTAGLFFSPRGARDALAPFPKRVTFRFPVTEKDSQTKPLRVGLISLGCAKNLVDAEIMLGSLVKSGIE